MSHVRVAFAPYIMWKSKYSRNKKLGGLKHIRCFPDHLGGSHKELTFCGTSVDVIVYLPEKNYNKVAVYGEFSESSGMDMYVGCQLTKKMNEDGSCLYQINNERKGWHYGWVGKRHLVGVTHTFNVYLFSVNRNIYTCISIIRSPPFVISCIRKGYRKKYKVSHLFENSDDETPLPHPLSVPGIDQSIGQMSPVLSFALLDLHSPSHKRKLDNIKSSVSSFTEYIPPSYSTSSGYYIDYNMSNYQSVDDYMQYAPEKRPRINITPQQPIPPNYIA